MPIPARVGLGSNRGAGNPMQSPYTRQDLTTEAITATWQGLCISRSWNQELKLSCKPRYCDRGLSGCLTGILTTRPNSTCPPPLQKSYLLVSFFKMHKWSCLDTLSRGLASKGMYFYIYVWEKHDSEMKILFQETMIMLCSFISGPNFISVA